MPLRRMFIEIFMARVVSVTRITISRKYDFNSNITSLVAAMLVKF